MSALSNIKVVPIASESLGVRSMCTYVETPDIKILLDAGVSLGPRRYGLPPHPKEYEVLKEKRETMLKVAETVDVVTVSHYHFDHQTPSYTDWAHNWSSAEIANRIYSDKLVFIKSYRSYVNPSQRRRGWMFVKTGGKNAEKLETADRRSFRFSNTTIKFSPPVFHGEEKSNLGWVVMATVECDEEERFLFASDVQGPMCDGTLDMILAEKPQLIMIGGPPLYLSGMVRQENIAKALKNLERIIQEVPITILEHHILRDPEWRNQAQPVFTAASRSGHRVITAAEFIGEENRLLESQRNRLFEDDPPSQEFMKWTRIPVLKRKLTRPPI